MIQELFLPCLYAFVASVAFAILFNIHGFGIVICGIGGTLGWLAYLLTFPYYMSPILPNFFAGITISLFAEIMSRIRKCPVTGYLMVAFFPLVPGGGIYYTMSYLLNNQRDLAVAKGLETFGIAGAIAIGVFLGSSLMRLVFAIIHHHRRA